mmetsp:Transcript_94201/g.177236  ORF Transcript_94201/g.177236 Transcript_94201/m.177236 type:complete len:536 (-) Transcript_94201:179-1786(-)
MHKYRLLSKKGEGTFSEVLKAQSIKTGKHVAIKCMKNTFDSIDQVNNLREIQALRRLGGHPNVIKLTEVLYDEPTGRLALVFELMDMNMYEAIRGRRHYLPEAKVQHCTFELLKALDHMHRHGIFHRDVKPENLLISSAVEDQVKLADLGSCRGIYSRQPYTEYISTRWYRAPECLLTDGYYNFKMDIFAAGCVWFEIMALFPLFPGSNELDQIQKIHNVLGTPSPDLLARKFKRNASHMDFNFAEKKGTGIERLVPHASSEVTDLMYKFLEYDPDDRIVARQALKDPYFKELREAERARGDSQTEMGASSRHTERPPAASMPNGQDTSSSVGSTAVHAADATTVEQAVEETEPPSSSTLPALSGGAARLKEMPPQAGDVHGDDDEPAMDDSTTLPPIGKAGLVGKQRSGKEKEKAKAFKAVANATLRGTSSSFNVTHTTNDSSSSSKGFERQPQGAASLANSAYGKNKFGGQSSSYWQSSNFGQTNSVGQNSFGQSSSSYAGGAAPAAERRDPKGQGQMQRQYVSPYSHKQVKR